MVRAGGGTVLSLLMATFVPVPALRAQVAPFDLSDRSPDVAGPRASAWGLLPSRIATGRVAPPRDEGPVLVPVPAAAAPYRQDGDGGVSPGRATFASALVPGAGQHLLAQRRKWVYLALEVVGWVAYVDRRGAGNDLRDAYRDFAWEEARVQSDPRIDGDWEYYETLTHWERSGLYDADPAAVGVQPESDPATYNGSIWELATKLFLPGGPGTPPQDPSYQRALAYYEERGYGTEFLWDWTGTGGAQGEYVDLISASDRRYRQATNVLGAIIANHVVSAADAFLSSRGVPTPAELRVMPHDTGLGTRWHAQLAFGVGG